MKVLSITNLTAPETGAIPVIVDIGDVEAHQKVTATGTNAFTAARIHVDTAVTIAIVSVSVSNTGVFFFGPQGGDVPIGSIVEVYSTGGSVTVYAGTSFLPSDNPPPFLNGDLSVTVTSGSRFKKTATAWAHLA